MKLYFDRDSRSYFVLLEDGPYNCYRCGYEINSTMLLNVGWYKDNGNVHQYFCHNCFNKKIQQNKFVVVNDFKLVGILHSMRKNSVFVFPKAPELVPGRVTTLCQAAKLKSDRTINKAWRSKNKNFMIDDKAKTPEQIEMNNRKLLNSATHNIPLDKDDIKVRGLSRVEIANKLSQMVNSKPLIESQERKRLK